MACIEEREMILEKAHKILRLTDEIKNHYDYLYHVLVWLSELDSSFKLDELGQIWEESENTNKKLFGKLEEFVALVKLYCEPIGQEEE